MTWAPILGTVLIVLGALVGCFTGGIYACNNYDVCFAPSDPAAAIAGVTTAPDGGLLVVLPPSTAPMVTEIEAFPAGYDSSPDGYPPPVWKIERTEPTPDWDGTVEVGGVPDGWRVVVPLSVPIGEVRGVLPGNGCYGASTHVPSKLPPAGTVVVDGGGETTSVADFQASWGGPITPCPGTVPPSALPPEVWASLGTVIAGVALLIAAAVARARRRSRQP